MAKSESVHKQIVRVRKPKVHITYEVAKPDGTQELKELPFVVGVMADLSGHPDPQAPLPKLSQRKMVSIDRDNFDEVLKGMKPRLAIEVDNTLNPKEQSLKVELRFSKLGDFDPDKVAEQVMPELLEARRKLKELRSLAEVRPDLADDLQALLEKTEIRDKAARATGAEGAGGEGTGTSS